MGPNGPKLRLHSFIQSAKLWHRCPALDTVNYKLRTFFFKLNDISKLSNSQFDKVNVITHVTCSLVATYLSLTGRHAQMVSRNNFPRDVRV